VYNDDYDDDDDVVISIDKTDSLNLSVLPSGKTYTNHDLCLLVSAYASWGEDHLNSDCQWSPSSKIPNLVLVSNQL